MAAHPQCQGLGGPTLAGRVGRHRLERRAALHLPGGDAADACAATARLRRQHGRSGDLHLRHRGAKAALPAAHCQSRRLVVPGLLGTGLGIRPRLAQGLGQARRQPLRCQRPEELDDVRAARRLDLLPGAHRSGGKEATGHLVHFDRYEEPRHHGAADSDDRRRGRGQRGVFRRRAGTGREPGGRGEQGLGLREIPARQRALRHRARRRVERAYPAHPRACRASSASAIRR